MKYIYFIITGIICLGLGIFFTLILNKTIFKKRRKKFMDGALAEAEMLKKEKILQAKETFLQLKAEHEKSINERSGKITEIEHKIRQKESQLSQRIEEFQRKQRELDIIRQNLNTQIDLISKKEAEIDKLYKNQIQQLEIIAGMSAKEAKNQLIESLKVEAKTEALSYIKDIVEESKLTANKEAKKIIIQTIQRLAIEQTVENTVTVFHIEDDVIKGRIIGREGRNIRALEAATGVDFNIDDTPDAIVLSCFDPLKREVARLALQQLVIDGRIHPARIEEIVAKTKKQLDQEIAEIGKRTCIDFGIHGLHPELTFLVGKMKYRTSYGQNLLQHSREVANLCAVMASELGLNAKTARRAGILHDIGKVCDDNPELSHAVLGMQLAEKYKEKQEICNAIGAHHEEIEMNTVIAPIVQICDTISGARPGARREIVQSYLKRLEDLEELALSFPGVQKTYAIHAGRELRVIVESDKVSDEQSQKMSIEISQRIQKEMTYPGQIKVIVIRETRAINIAK